MVTEIHRLEDGQRVDDERDALLVIGDAKAIGTVAIDAEWLLRQHAAQIDGIHVRDQQDFLRTGSGETRQHHLAGLLGRVDHAVSVSRVRLDQFDLATNPRQALCNERGELIEPFAIPASGFDRHQFLKRIKERRLLLRG